MYLKKNIREISGKYTHLLQEINEDQHINQE